LFIGRAPSSNEAADELWWVIGNGGTPLSRASTGETVKNYQVQVYYRSRDYQRIADAMQQLEEDLNCDRCTPLEGFDTLDIEATVFPIDNDLDSEDRKVGLLQVSLTTYKECV